jgi:hypothetical protein
MSLKKQILEALLQLIRSGEDNDLNFQNISSFSGISMADIKSNFDTEEQLYDALSQSRINVHFEKSKNILGNPNPLQNLLNHDLELVYRINFFAKKYHSSSVAGAIGRKSIQDIQVKMHQHYEQILNTKVYLMPEDVQDSVLYAKFITHSLFFLTKENLDQILPADLTKESATRQIIESLFPKIDLGF